MATFAYQPIGYAGTDLVFSAPAGGVAGDAVPPDPKGFLWVKNAAAGGTIAVAVTVPGDKFGVVYPSVSVSIPDGEGRLIGPLVDELANPALFNLVTLSITPNVTGVTAAAVKVP